MKLQHAIALLTVMGGVDAKVWATFFSGEYCNWLLEPQN